MQMEVLDATGHTTTAWNPDNAAEVAAARAMFDAMTGKGYRAFHIGKRGQQAARMDEFDPAAEQMILVPHVAGG